MCMRERKSLRKSSVFTLLFDDSETMTGKINLKNMLRILYDDFDQKVKNIHDEMNKHHSIYKKKRVP